MEDRITKCDICEVILQIGGQKIKDKFGITWTFGYSKGGWGSRQDKPSFTGEVCKDCYDEFLTLTENFNKSLLFRRKGINKQQIKISNATV